MSPTNPRQLSVSIGTCNVLYVRQGRLYLMQANGGTQTELDLGAMPDALKQLGIAVTTMQVHLKDQP